MVSEALTARISPALLKNIFRWYNHKLNNWLKPESHLGILALPVVS